MFKTEVYRTRHFRGSRVGNASKLGYIGVLRSLCEQTAYLKSSEIGLNCNFTLQYVILVLTFLTLSKLVVHSPSQSLTAQANYSKHAETCLNYADFTDISKQFLKIPMVILSFQYHKNYFDILVEFA